MVSEDNSAALKVPAMRKIPKLVDQVSGVRASERFSRGAKGCGNRDQRS